MCWSMVTLRRPSSHSTVKLSRPPPALPPPFSHCLSRRSSAQGGLTTRGFTAATTSGVQTERRRRDSRVETLNTHTHASMLLIQHIENILISFLRDRQDQANNPPLHKGNKKKIQNKAEALRSLTQWWKQETHRGPDLSRPQPAGSQSDWPGQPRCTRSPWCSRSHWPTQEGQVWWTGQCSEYWTGSGQARVGRVGTHCWRTTERDRRRSYYSAVE